MKILFLCRANAGRSQWAEAFFNGLSKKSRATSAGIAVTGGGTVPDLVVESARELGYDLSGKERVQLTREMAAAADKIIVILEPKEVDELVPDYLKKEFSKKVDYWSVRDAKGTTYSEHCKIRDEIKQLVEALVQETE